MRSEEKHEREEDGNVRESLQPRTSRFSLPNSQFSPPPQEIAERAFDFAVRVVKLCQTLDERKGVPRTLANQLLRAGTSIGANLEESKGGQSRADFLTKVSISLKEARECRYWLRLLIAGNIVPETLLAPLIDESNQLVAILTAIVKKVKAAP